MERSTDVADAVLGFYEAFAVGTGEAFDRVVSGERDVTVIGTEPGWRRDDRASWRAAFVGLGGVTVEPGEVLGYRDGTVGWAVDDPTWVTSDGRRLPLRLTAVACEEPDGWRLVQLHISVGVPDAVALAADGWGAAAPG
jgi:hypothetical protein